ncbi:MAG: hypothetical protein ACX93T_04220 [Bacteroidota bacterium]
MKAITVYKKKATRQRLELLNKKIVNEIAPKGVFPYVYDLDHVYMYPNSIIDSFIEWVSLSREHHTNLRGDFHAMIGGFLFLKQSNQMLSAIDIQKHVGRIHIRL